MKDPNNFMVGEDPKDKRILELAAAVKDARYLIAALIKAAGGRVELSPTIVMSISSRDQITTWDDPISGKKVCTLTELTTSETSAQNEVKP